MDYLKKCFGICLLFSFFVSMLLLLPNPDSAYAYYNSRLSGIDRYLTAVDISQEGWDKSDYVVLVSGEDFADALCSGPLAKKFNAPILYTEKTSLNKDTLKEIERLDASNVLIIGGYGAISKDVEESLDSDTSATIERIYGADRYATSVEIAKRLGSKKAALANGNNYADTLSISAIAATQDIAILLSPANVLPEVVRMHLKNYQITKTYIIGGSSVISAGIEAQAPSPVRLAGNNRYDTNRVVLEYFAKNLDYNNIYVGTADNPDGFAASLAGIALAAKTSSPLILCGTERSAITENLARSQMTVASYLYALGGTGSVSDHIINGLNQSYDQVQKSIFSQSGVYGPSSGTTTIGNLAIETRDVVVQNIIIQGDLLLGQGISSGTVILKNVTVNGRITVRGCGGGKTSGDTLIAKSLVIDVTNGRETTIDLDGKSQIQNLRMGTDATLDASDCTASTPFTTVTIVRGESAELLGNFGTVNVAADGVSIDLDTAKITTLNANSEMTLSGSGTIGTANIGSDDVTLDIKPGTVNNDDDYDVNIEGE